MLKKCLSVFILISFLLVLSGCGFKTVDIASSLLVECIGIDFKEDEFNISIQVMNTLTTSTSPENVQNEEITLVYESKGRSVGEAIGGFEKDLGKNIMISHNRLIIIGKAAAENGLNKIMDYFVRNPASRSTVPIAVCEEEAKELLSANYGKGVIGVKMLENLIVLGMDNSYLPESELFRVVNDLRDKTSNSYLPLLKLKKLEGDNEEKFIPEIGGTAIFLKDKLVGHLPVEETRGALFINNSIKHGTYVIEGEEKSLYTLSIIRSKTKTQMTLSEGSPVFKMIVKCVCDVIESGNLSPDYLNNSQLEQIEKLLGEKIKGQMENAINLSAKEQGSDIFMFGRYLWLKNAEAYRLLSENWQEEVKKVSAEIKVEIDIKLLGREAIKNS